ncbi:glycosyltransferase family 4 protein [Roseiconus nitratireducens]|nr:glycosyltransferase family 4 protein [Roseiconus nitratireducens]
MTSHSFIRREIAALEERGTRIVRYSVRSTTGSLLDPRDRAESERTDSILDHPGGMLGSALTTLLGKPLRTFRALALAIRLGKRSRTGVLKHLIYLAEACWFANHARRQGVDHVHVHFGTNSATVALLSKVLGGPRYSMTCHGPEEFDYPLEIALREKIHEARFVVGVSSFGRSQLYRWCDHEEWPKIGVVHCGLDDHYLNDDTRRPYHDRRFVCLGRLCEQKGQILLVQAVGALRRRGVAVELVLVGDGEMRPQIEKLIRDEGLHDSVQITGWQNGDQVSEWLQDCRAMVLPSFAEGLPVAIMEALALRRPVISTYIAGIPELVDASCGWLVPAGSIEALGDALHDCLSRREDELERMGNVGAERVRRRHDVRKEARTLSSLLGLSAESDRPALEPAK